MDRCCLWHFLLLPFSCLTFLAPYQPDSFPVSCVSFPGLYSPLGFVLGFLFCVFFVCVCVFFYVFVSVPFNAIRHNLWNLDSPVRDQCWNFGGGVMSQENSPGIINYWELPWMPPPVYKTHHLPAASSTQCRMPHSNYEQDKPSHQQAGFLMDTTKYHLTQPCPLEENQKPHLLPEKHRHNSLPAWSPHQLWDQICPPRAENERKK